MTALVAALCAGGSVALALHRAAPVGRLRRARHTRSTPRPLALVDALGRLVRHAAGRRPHPRADRRAGAAVLVGAVGLAVGMEVALTLAGALAVGGRWRAMKAHRDAAPDPAIVRDLPDLVDLVALAVAGGLSVPAALPLVAPVTPASLRPALDQAVAAVAAGRPTDEAVAELGRRWGPAARPLVHALVDHLRYGTPVLPPLERVALEARARRRRAAETRARRLPVLLLFPLVLCTLPAFGLLTVAPLVAGTFDSLQGSRLEAPASPAP